MTDRRVSDEEFIRLLFARAATVTTETLRAAGVIDVTGKPKPSGFRNPMTSRGDTIYGGESGAALRRGVGALGQVYTLVDDGAGGLAPDWRDADGGSGAVDASRLDLLTNGDASNPALIWGITETGDVRVIFTERSA